MACRQASGVALLLSSLLPLSLCTVGAALLVVVTAKSLTDDGQLESSRGSIAVGGEAISPYAEPWVLLFLLVLTGVAVLWLVHTVGEGLSSRRAAGRCGLMMDDTAGHFVFLAQLSEQDREILVRAQAAADAILASDVHAEDLVDQQRNALSLPTHVWQVAEHSRLVQAHPQTDPIRRLRAVSDARLPPWPRPCGDRACRAVVLETYARQVAEAGDQLRQWCQGGELAEGAEDVLSLLARTATNDGAVAEPAGLACEAAVVAAHLRPAVESARAAGARALGTVECALTAGGPVPIADRGRGDA